jgi:RimJ/RimL family protein N-acetyltransferase
VTRITIEPFTVDHAAAVVDGDRHATWAEGYPTDGDVEVAERLLSGEWSLPADGSPWHAWRVIDETGTVVGGVGFHGPPSDGDVEIGYGIAEGVRGRGIATLAVGRTLDLARAAGAHRVVAGTDPDNAASQRVLEKCGFTRTPAEGDEIRWELVLSD